MRHDCGAISDPRWMDERRICMREPGHEGYHSAFDGRSSFWEWADSTPGAISSSDT